MPALFYRSRTSRQHSLKLKTRFKKIKNQDCFHLILKISDIGHVKVNEGDAVSFACVGETSNEINVLNLMIADKLEKISNVLMNPEALIPLKANEEPIVDQVSNILIIGIHIDASNS